MFHTVKKRLYFLVASYFRFWASIRLKRWSPKVIVITGSAGKTTLLHMLEAQLGREAYYSHHANSAFGIPFDILGLEAIQQSRVEWFGKFVLAPLALLKPTKSQKYYVVEADADRPHEAKFLARLLNPSITLWVSSLHSHTQQYDKQVHSGRFNNSLQAVASEYAELAIKTTELVVYDGDNEQILEQLPKITAQTTPVKISQLSNYTLTRQSTTFQFDGHTYHVPALLPKNNFYQILMTHQLLNFLSKKPDYNFMNFKMPPGRSNTFRGIKDTILFDSTYNNSNVQSLVSILQLFADYPTKNKWVVIGDLLEQGKDEAVEHEKIAEPLSGMDLDKIILIGPRVAKHTYPLLKTMIQNPKTELLVYEEPAEVLNYLQHNIMGGETILFKGARFLEGIIEQLLSDKSDADKLVRRGNFWNKKRALWGLK